MTALLIEKSAIASAKLAGPMFRRKCKADHTSARAFLGHDRVSRESSQPPYLSTSNFRSPCHDNPSEVCRLFDQKSAAGLLEPRHREEIGAFRLRQIINFPEVEAG